MSGFAFLRSSLSRADIDASTVQAVANAVSAFGDVGAYTLATLPNPATYERRTVWVTDLWSALPAAQRGGRMVSEGGFWKAIRPLVTMSLPVASLTTIPWATPTTLVMTGALGLGVTMNVTLGLGSGFAVPSPGYRQRVVKPAGVLGVLNVIGLNTRALTGWADYEFTGTSWEQTASGGLL